MTSCSRNGWWTYWLAISKLWFYYRECYRSLGPPTFFQPPTLSAVPTAMGHDHQWWRDLCRDLGAIYRQWCSKHHLLKLSPTTSFLFSFYISFWTYLYSCQYNYALHSFLVIMLTLWHCHNYAPSLPHNHAYLSVLFLLMIIDIASSAALSLYVPHIPLFPFFLIYPYQP